jgi:hypothetical protein
MRIIIALIILQLLYLPVESQYAFSTGSKGYGAVWSDSSVIKSWAVQCRITRGYMNIEDKSLGLASTGSDISCTGKADNITASLGDSGVAVLSFSEPITDITGNDFAVFENSFDGTFLELAFAEVSTDSIRWVRFPSVSNNQTLTQIGTFGNLDPSKTANLAGKYRAFYGTPFDLADIKDSSGISLTNIKYIRIIDVLGAISGNHVSFDSRGTKINDPWPTPFPQSGFDLDAVAVLKSVSSDIPSTNNFSNMVYPNPAKNKIFVRVDSPSEKSIRVIDVTGRLIKRVTDNDILSGIDISELHSGIYFLEISENRSRSVTRIVKE